MAIDRTELKILVNTGTEIVSESVFLHSTCVFVSRLPLKLRYFYVVGEKVCKNYSASKKSWKLSFVFDSVFQRSCQFNIHNIAG